MSPKAAEPIPNRHEGRSCSRCFRSLTNDNAHCENVQCVWCVSCVQSVRNGTK